MLGSGCGKPGVGWPSLVRLEIARPFNHRVSTANLPFSAFQRVVCVCFVLFCFVFWVASSVFPARVCILLSWEPQGESSLRHLVWTRNLIRGLCSVLRDPRRLPVIEKMNLVSGFISAESVLFLYASASCSCL